MNSAKSKEEIDEIVEKEFIPGTAHLIDIQGTLNVKKNNDSKHDDIVLIPQPSSSPRDPLNWSKNRKLLHYYLLLIWGFLVLLDINFMGPIWDYLVADLKNTTYNTLSNAGAINYAGLGAGCVLLQPTAMKVGRRGTYMCASIIILVSLVVGGTSKTIILLYFTNLLGGIGAAPVDSLVQVSTTDIFFQHERGDKLSAFIFVIYAGSYIGPIISGQFGSINDGIGWRWTYWLCLMLQGVFFFFQFSLMEDSTFRRDHLSTDVEETILRQITTEREVPPLDEEENFDKDNEKCDIEEVASDDELMRPQTYRERLKIFNMKYNDPRSWFIIALRPLLCLSFPPVIFGGVLYGVQIMFLSLTGNTQTAIFTAEPYNFSSNLVGNTNISSLVGSIIGMVYGGRVADWVTLTLARRNKGVLEPEMRLWAMIPPTIVCGAGLLMYGLGAHYGVHWFVPAGLGCACIAIGICSCGPIVITYAIDCYPALASETVVLILFVRNMIGCGFTFAVTPWLDKVGLPVFTWTVFAICLFMNGTSFIMIMFGKTFRRKTKHLYLRFQDKTKLFF